MEKGKIKDLRINLEKDMGAILFEDDKAFYIPINTVKNLYRTLGSPIGCWIEYECDGQPLEGESVISCVWFV